MLDARRAEQKGYITLKEAAKLSNYSPDYIGQLIRSGKISGEQVYSNVAWVTTEAEVMSYLSRAKARGKSGAVEVEQENEVIVKRYTNPVVYAGIVLVSLVLFCTLYIGFVSIDHAIERSFAAQVIDEDINIYAYD